jgi:hypothetical protein
MLLIIILTYFVTKEKNRLDNKYTKDLNTFLKNFNFSYTTTFRILQNVVSKIFVVFKNFVRNLLALKIIKCFAKDKTQPYGTIPVRVLNKGVREKRNLRFLFNFDGQGKKTRRVFFFFIA